MRCITLLLGVGGFAGSVLADDGKLLERTTHYDITGTTGAELYASIGEHGPETKGGRVVAHTNFKLTWRRDYKPNDGGCTLVSAVPNLVVTYTLPKPSKSLGPAAERSWKTFVEAIAAHERVHGRQIIDMTRQMQTQSVGLSVMDDPGCTKIRTELTKRIAALSLAQRAAARDFDQVEMARGGPIEQLILALVNGP